MEPSFPESRSSDARPLSSRELEVLEMTARGLSNRQIASQLCVSVHAVKFHLGAVYRKLGVANRTEAAVMYLRSVQNTLSLEQAEH